METNERIKIYASNNSDFNRLKIVGAAVEKVANSLRLKTELSSRKRLLSIYVYYRGEEGEEIPVYCDWGKRWKENDVYHAIRNMMFVLSFHPHHSSLRRIRKELCASA